MLARRAHWRYVAGRALRRHRDWTLGIGLALVALAVGIVAEPYRELGERDRYEDLRSRRVGLARMLCLMGRRAEAMARFAEIRRWIPTPPGSGDAWQALNSIANCLAAQGDAARAVPLLEGERKASVSPTSAPHAWCCQERLLGESYEAVERIDEARQTLMSSFESDVATTPADDQTRVAATERWARFLVAQGEVDSAARLFGEVLAQDHDRHFAHTALAQASLSRLALAESLRHDVPQAASLAEAREILMLAR